MTSERVPIGVLISGRGSNMIALAEAARAADCPYRIALVAANDPHAAGLDAARKRGIPTWARTHTGLKRAEFDRIVHGALIAHDVRFVALAGYMRLLSPEFVANWAGKMVNIHPSLLPRHKGLDTHARSLAAGDRAHGCSVHLVTEGLDDGPVLGRAEVPVLPGDTPDTLAARVLVEEHLLYPRIVAEMVTR